MPGAWRCTRTRDEWWSCEPQQPDDQQETPAESVEDFVEADLRCLLRDRAFEHRRPTLQVATANGQHRAIGGWIVNRYMLGQLRRAMKPVVNAISTALLALTLVLLSLFYLLTRKKD